MYTHVSNECKHGIREDMVQMKPETNNEELEIVKIEDLLPKKKTKKVLKKPIILTTAGFFAVCTIVLIVYSTVKGRQEKEALKNPPARTVFVEKRNLEKELSVTGTIISGTKRSVQSEAVDIKVMEVKAVVGDVVKEGDILCILDSSTMEEKLLYAQKNNEIAIQKSALDVENANLQLRNAQTVRDTGIGQDSQALLDAWKEYETTVKKMNTAYTEWQAAIANRGQKQSAVGSAKSSASDTNGSLQSAKLIVEERQNVYDAAESRLTEAKNKSVSGNQAITPEELARLTNERDSAHGLLLAAKRELSEKENEAAKRVEDKSEQEAGYGEAKSTESAKEAEYKQSVINLENAAKAYQKLLKDVGGNVREHEKSLEEQNINARKAELDKQAVAYAETQSSMEKYQNLVTACTVTAPCDGTVTAVNIEKGSLYKGGELLVIQDTSNLMIQANVDQYAISDVEKGLSAYVESEALGKEPLSGTVEFVSPVPVKSTGSAKTPEGSETGSGISNDYEIRVGLNDFNERMRLGMTVKTRIVYSLEAYASAEHTAADGEHLLLTCMEMGVDDYQPVFFQILDSSLHVQYSSATEAGGIDAYTKEQLDYLTEKSADGYALYRFDYETVQGEKRTLLLHVPQVDEHSYSKISKLWKMLLFVFAFCYIIMTALFSYSLNRKVEVPLMVLEQGISDVAHGKKNTAVVYSGQREFEQICENFNQMVYRLRKSEESQKKLIEEKMRILADISHDLKTPITVVQGYAKAIADGLIEPEKQQKYLERLVAKTEELNDLINVFYTYSKLEHPDFILQLVRTDIVEQCRGFLAQKYEEIELQGFFLDAEFLEEAVFCLVDQMQINRVFENIIGNTLKHNDRGVGITVRMFLEKEYIHILIGDNGTGIPETIRAAVFDPFVVGDESRGTHQGSGLGMALAKKIVEKHGGMLALVGTEIGELRTCFCISLPLA